MPSSMSSLSLNPKTCAGHVLTADASRATSVTASSAGPASQLNECRQRGGLATSAHRCAPPATRKKTCATSVAASPGVVLSHTLRRIATIGSEKAFQQRKCRRRHRYLELNCRAQCCRAPLPLRMEFPCLLSRKLVQSTTSPSPSRVLLQSTLQQHLMRHRDAQSTLQEGGLKDAECKKKRKHHRLSSAFNRSQELQRDNAGT